jgi:hypothetical protein
MPLLRTLSRVSKLSCNAKFPPHITLVRLQPHLRPNSWIDDSSATHRHLLSLGSRPSPTSRVMPHRHSLKLKRRPQIISLVFRSTQVICLPTPRMSAKCSSNGTGPPDQSCGLTVHPFQLFVGDRVLNFELVLKAITYGYVITVDALNVSTPSRSRG